MFRVQGLGFRVWGQGFRESRRGCGRERRHGENRSPDGVKLRVKRLGLKTTGEPSLWPP